jgi:hypothetical protein
MVREWMAVGSGEAGACGVECNNIKVSYLINIYILIIYY